MRKILISTVSALALTGSFFMSSAYADIIIGFMGPITGPVAAYGIQANNGVKVAVDELNKNGGINGEKLVLKVFDDGAEPKQGVSAANQLIGEGIQYVIGPFKVALNKGGVTEVLYGNITPGEKDYSVMVSRLKQEKVDYVYFGGYHPEAGLLLKQMREQGLEAPLIGGDGFNTSELWSIAGNAAEGTMFTNSVDVKGNPDAQETIKALKAQNIPPETFAINGYAKVFSMYKWHNGEIVSAE